MGAIAFTNHFQGPNRYGWSERIYLAGVTSIGDPALQRVLAWRNARRMMLAAGITDNGGSLHDEALPGSSYPLEPVDYPANSNAYNPIFSGEEPDYAWTDLLIGTDTSDNQHHGRLFLGGLEDTLTHSQQRGVTAATFMASYQAWASIAVNGQYGSKFLRKGNTNPLVQVESITVDNVLGKFKWKSTAHGLAANAVIKYYKVFGQSALSPTQKNYSGTSPITVIDADNFTVDKFYTPAQFTVIRPGKYRQNSFDVLAWTRLYQVAVKNKKRGVGHAPPRGRSRNRGPKA